MPVYSQKFPKSVVPNMLYYIQPQEANDANYLEETIPTQKVKLALDYILDSAQVPRK